MDAQQFNQPPNQAIILGAAEHMPPARSPSPLNEPPVDEEIDKSICARPWILRKRITWQAYLARCQRLGVQPDSREWSAHLELTDAELDVLNKLQGTPIDCYLDEFCHKFTIENWGGKPRVCWFDNGEIVAQSVGDFRTAANLHKVIENRPRGRKRRLQAGR